MKIKKSQNYALFFENIKQKTPIEAYANIFHSNAKFKDPFNEVQGVENIYNIFQDMYTTLDNPKFRVIETIEQDNVTYLQWIFEYNFKNDSLQNSFRGVSRVEFDKNNMALSHIDYWDAAENVYEKIPILSYFIKLIKRKIAK